MNNPLFSIITITYNSEKTVERTIKSVLAQTCKDYEYIIVDGASKDSTIDIVKQYEPLFEGRMKWKSEPDSGIYNAMNKGISRATGNVIGIVNSDDWLEPDALNDVALAFSTINNPRSSIVCGSIRFHYADGESQVMYSDKSRFYKGIKNHSFGHGAYHPSMFVGNGVYKNIGNFDENFYIAADIDFVYRCYQNDVQFYFIREILNNMSDGGVSNAVAFKKILSDKRYDAKKRNLSRIDLYTTLFQFFVKQIIKAFMPSNFQSRYRQIRAN